MLELADGPPSLALSELAERLQLPPSTLHRMLATLGRRGFVLQDGATRRYRLGPAVLRLGDQYARHFDLVGIAQAGLRDLTLRTQETVFLTAYDGGSAICVSTAESPRPLQFFMRIGQRMPFHCAASAKAILAFRSPDEIERALLEERFEPFTPATPVDADAVRRDLALVRAHGFAACDEEMEVGVTALSAPVRDARGEVVASITLVAPAERLAGSRRAAPLQSLMEAAANISARLGYQSAAGARADREGCPLRDASMPSLSTPAAVDRPASIGRPPTKWEVS